MQGKVTDDFRHCFLFSSFYFLPTRYSKIVFKAKASNSEEIRRICNRFDDIIDQKSVVKDMKNSKEKLKIIWLRIR